MSRLDSWQSSFYGGLSSIRMDSSHHQRRRTARAERAKLTPTHSESLSATAPVLRPGFITPTSRPSTVLPGTGRPSSTLRPFDPSTLPSAFHPHSESGIPHHQNPGLVLPKSLRPPPLHSLTTVSNITLQSNGRLGVVPPPGQDGGRREALLAHNPTAAAT